MRTPNINKLYNKLLECESEWKALEKSGSKISRVILKGSLDSFLSCRNRFRTVYERFLVEEPKFFIENGLFDSFWRQCYAELIDDLQSAIKEQKSLADRNKLTQFLRFLVFEGISLFSLLLKVSKFSASIRFELLLALAQLKHLQESGLEQQQLVEEAIKLFPENGRSLYLLAKFAHDNSDFFLALYWCLSALSAKQPSGQEALSLLKTVASHIAERPGNALYSPSRLKLMKPAKRAALDSTLLALSPILQLLAHGISNQLGNKSHFKHMDTFAHARLTHLPTDQVDLEVVERVMEAFWLALLNKKLFPEETIILPQAVMLSGLFRFMCKFNFAGTVDGIRLFSGKNYEIAGKIYPFFADCLHEFLDLLIKNSSNYGSQYFLKLVEVGLIVEHEGQFVIRPVFERSCRMNRSMKVLTHRLLESRVNELASPIEAAERLQQISWKIVDFEALVQDWKTIKMACLENSDRFFVSLALLDQLDVAKQSDSQVREIIRFIHNAVNQNNPSIRLQSVQEGSSALRLSREEFKRIEEKATKSFEGTPFTVKALIRFWCEHLKAIRYLKSQSEPVQVYCKNELFNESP